MFRRKLKTERVMTQVIVEFKNKGELTHREIIKLEPGQVFKKGFASDPRVVNRDGTVARSFEWSTNLKHDNSIEYQYSYEIQEIV